ncbi:unnamed protein product [Prunus armeniaca]
MPSSRRGELQGVRDFALKHGWRRWEWTRADVRWALNWRSGGFGLGTGARRHWFQRRLDVGLAHAGARAGQKVKAGLIYCTGLWCDEVESVGLANACWARGASCAATDAGLRAGAAAGLTPSDLG